MRERRTSEEMTEKLPVIYRRNRIDHYFNDRREDVTGRMLSSFPWRDDEDGEEFEWKHSWTRLRNYYVDDIMLREELTELINKRFAHVSVV